MHAMLKSKTEEDARFYLRNDLPKVARRLVFKKGIANFLGISKALKPYEPALPKIEILEEHKKLKRS